MSKMKQFQYGLLAAIVLLCVGAVGYYTIDDLANNAAPGAGTIIEIYDPTATPRSGKLTLNSAAFRTATGLTYPTLTNLLLFPGDNTKFMDGDSDWRVLTIADISDFDKDAITNALGMNLRAELDSKAPNFAPNTYTVDTLPTVTHPGAFAWCSDVITPEGSGGLLVWDGSIWKIESTKLQAFDDIPSFMFECLKRGWSGTTPFSAARICDVMQAQTTGPEFMVGNTQTSGTGASAALSYSAAGKEGSQFACGTTEGARVTLSGPQWRATAGDYMLISASFCPSALASDTEDYYLLYGMGSGTTGIGNDGHWFVYDRTNSLAFNQPLTNNWLCVSKASSSGEVIASPIAVTASPTYQTLSILVYGTAWAKFYINGAPVATNETYVSAASLYTPQFHMQRVAGSTTRSTSVDWSYRHIRWVTERQFFP